MDLSAVPHGDEIDPPPNAADDSTNLPSNESRSSNPHPNPLAANMSLSQLAPPDDEPSNPSKESLISPDLRTDDDYSDEEDIDQRHNRSGTMSYNQNGQMQPDGDPNLEEEDYDHFDDDDGLRLSVSMAAGHHRRNSSMAERQAHLKAKKEAMEQKLRSLSQNLDKGLDAALDEFVEMERINADKELFSKLFDKIDPEENGDVDETEWIAGLKRMNVGILEADMAKLFRLMDGDVSGFIDRQDWITFCMQHYESKELQRLHDSVLSHIKGHSRKPSNMIHAQDADHWSADQVRNLEKQMTQALIVHGRDELEHAAEEEEFIADIQHQADQDPNWAKPERALDWSPKEVAFWLDTLELSQYARKFDEDRVDGSILLNDCDKQMLCNDMGIKNLHVGKILREVDKLRKINKDKDGLQESYKDWNELINDNHDLSERLLEANNAIKELEAQNAELRLKTISAVNPGLIVPPMMDDAPSLIGGDTTNGMEERERLDDGLLTETNAKDNNQLRIMEAEINHLRKQKIEFAARAADEIYNLNRIIRILTSEYTTMHTPYFKRFNPVDSIIRSLGYQPAEQK